MFGELGHGRQRVTASPLVRLHAAAQVRQDALSRWLRRTRLTWHKIMLTRLVTVSILSTLTTVDTLSTVSIVDKNTVVEEEDA